MELPLIQDMKFPYGWVGYNSGPCDWFWAKDRKDLEHELSDDIRPASYLEMYLLKEKERVLESLAPFYEHFKVYNPDAPDSVIIPISVTIGELRKVAEIYGRRY